MASIRILHASDLHISQNPFTTSALDYISSGMYWDAMSSRTLVSSYNPAILYHLAEFIYDNYLHSTPAPVDAIILTGDIATTGMKGDLEMALRFVEGPQSGADPLMCASLIPTLASAAEADAHRTGSNKIPLWLLPGNHDRLRKLTPPSGMPDIFYLPCGKEFEMIFANHWSSTVREFPTISRSSLSVKLIAADFNLRRPWDYSGPWFFNMYAQGRVYEDVLGELVRTTVDAMRRSPGPLAILWAVHFPPNFPLIPESMKLNEDDLLLDAADHCGVHAILAGHTHEAIYYRPPNKNVDVFCAGTTTQDHAPKGHFFHILQVSDDTNGNIDVNRENYYFDALTRRFIPI